MTHVAEALSLALLHFVWQGIAAGVVWGMVLLVLRKRSANSRYMAGCVVLVALALAPVVTGVLVWQAADIPLEAVAGGSGSVSTLAVSPGETAIPTTLLGRLDNWILPLWTAGVFVFTLRFVWAAAHASSLRRRGVEADSVIQSVIEGLAERLGIRRKLRVLMSSVAEVPAVVGWLRPVILLPAAVVVGLTPQQLESLLVHELAHIRRYDYFVNILQMVVETLLFYHPAVWWVSSRIRYERELCCDDLAVRSCGDALSYARALAQLERLRPIGPSLVMGSVNGPLFRRIHRLLERGKSEHVPSRLACAAGLLTGFLCLGWFMSARAQQRETLPPLQEFATTLQELAPVSPMPPLPSVAPVVAATIAPAAVPAPLVPMSPAAPAPLAAMPPAALVPPIVPAPAALIPVPPQDPVPIKQNVLSLLAVLPGFSLPQDAHWVLFRGNSTTTRGGAADEEQAKKTRATLTGDLLWFQLDGKTFVTQDKDVMDRIQALVTGMDSRLAALTQGVAQLERQLAESRALQAREHELQANLELIDRNLPNSPPATPNPQQKELEATRFQMMSRLQVLNAEMQALQANLEQVNRTLPNSTGTTANPQQKEPEAIRSQMMSRLQVLNAEMQALQASLEQVNRNLTNTTGTTANPQQKELEAIRFQMMSRLQVLNAEMQALAARREVELRAMQSELEAMQQRDGLSAARETEILRGAVQEGKAQVVP